MIVYWIVDFYLPGCGLWHHDLVLLVFTSTCYNYRVTPDRYCVVRILLRSAEITENEIQAIEFIIVDESREPNVLLLSSKLLTI